MSETSANRVNFIESGDVYMLETPVASFVLLVLNKANEKVDFLWLAHPDSGYVSLRDWMWENTLCAANIWTKIAHAA